MSTRTDSSPSARAQAAFQLWLANLGLGVVVGTAYLTHLSETEGLRSWIFATLALVSTVATLTLAPGIGFLVATRCVRSVRALGAAQAFGWIAFQILLFADTRIYNLFRYHFNGHVWNLIYTRGSEDAVHLGWQVWAAIGAGLVIGFSVQYALWRRWLARAEEVAEDRRLPYRLLRPSLVVGVLVLSAVGLEKTIYAQADLTQDKELLRLARMFPFYPRLPARAARDLYDEMLGRHVERGPRVDVDVDEVRLDYPRATPRIDPDGPRPNLLMVVIDCWRADMLEPEVTPRLSALADESLRFDDHLSGGNSTRFGLFSLLYGLHGSYWFPVLEQRRSPVLVDALLERGYDVRVFSAASMYYPELRSTAWARVADHVYDEFPGETPWERDVQAAAAFESWIGELEAAGDERPWFGFLLLDSPHPTYSSPPDGRPFAPAAPEVNYLRMSSVDGPDEELERAVFNRYRNAVHHADRVTGRILDVLAERGLADETLVLVTGDHGEEFLENGYFGHTSNFTAEQVAVPLLLRGPGIEPGRVSAPTAHVDVAPTLLELLGADRSDRPLWTVGRSLFDPPQPGRKRVVSGWMELGLWIEDGILRVPLVDRWSFDVELYDRSWRFRTDDEDVLRRETAALEALAEECTRFLADRSEGDAGQ